MVLWYFPLSASQEQFLNIYPKIWEQKHGRKNMGAKTWAQKHEALSYVTKLSEEKLKLEDPLHGFSTSISALQDAIVA